MALAGDRPVALQRLDGPGARAGGEYNGPGPGEVTVIKQKRAT
jgi:hypothetical protein